MNLSKILYKYLTHVTSVSSVVAVFLGLDGGVGNAFETELSICGSNHIGIRWQIPADGRSKTAFFGRAATICTVCNRSGITSHF